MHVTKADKQCQQVKATTGILLQNVLSAVLATGQVARPSLQSAVESAAAYGGLSLNTCCICLYKALTCTSCKAGIAP
jgi:hypothetical protein